MESVGNALHNIEISIHNLEEAVDKVGTASGEIVDIIKLIGDIAEETNLLSLNASIEAARAGEAGRGFAVVASQIGVLAKNSADSVAHITSLINEINGLVDDAVKQGRSSASDIESSADLIHTAVDTFDQIFQNIQETSHLIEGVVEKINQVDQVATNVAAISEEQAASSDEILATSESMLQQAKSISRTVNRWKRKPEIWQNLQTSWRIRSSSFRYRRVKGHEESNQLYDMRPASCGLHGRMRQYRRQIRQRKRNQNYDVVVTGR